MVGTGASLARLARSFFERPDLAPDGHRLPPGRLIRLVAGSADSAWYWQGGQLGARTLRDLFSGEGIRLAGLRSILDFGCGCGRVIRHLPAEAPAARLHGSDYNPALVRWCRWALPGIEFTANRLAPPLTFANESFDLVYAFSVFTHLAVPMQHAWLAELRRVTRPGAWIVMTTHGEYYLNQLGAVDRERFQSGEAVVWSAESEGDNRCATFHPPTFVRDVLAPAASLLIRRFVREGAKGNPHQDLWLLQRPA